MNVRWMTAFLDLPASAYDDGVAFWCSATGTTLSAARGEQGEFATLVPPSGDSWLRVQRVASDVGGVHLDLHVEDVTSYAWRAVSLGAKEKTRVGEELVVLTSPGGLDFCVVPWQGEAERGDAEAGVVDQVCLDVDPGDFEQEAGFWADLTTWEIARGSRPEFVVLHRPEGQALRLLLQRRDDAGPGPVSAHLDLAAGDRVAEVVARHTALGARSLREIGTWVTLRDPAGREYCVTARDPGSGRLLLPT